MFEVKFFIYHYTIVLNCVLIPQNCYKTISCKMVQLIERMSRVCKTLFKAKSGHFEESTQQRTVFLHFPLADIFTCRL